MDAIEAPWVTAGVSTSPVVSGVLTEAAYDRHAPELSYVEVLGNSKTLTVQLYPSYAVCERCRFPVSRNQILPGTRATSADAAGCEEAVRAL